jgi:hypothetical protein
MNISYLRFVTLFLLSVSVNSFAQDIGQAYIMGLGEFINYNNINKGFNEVKSYDEIKGSPFLLDNFVVGQVQLKNGKIYKGPLRYDIYAGNIEFKTESGEIYSVLNPEKIKLVILDDHQIVYLGNDSLIKSGSFYEEIITGGYTLLAKYKVILTDPVPAKPYIEPKPAMFVKKDTEYSIYSKNTGLINIKNKNDLSRVDLTRSDEISAFVKKNKIRISDQSSLEEFVKFLNSNPK